VGESETTTKLWGEKRGKNEGPIERKRGKKDKDLVLKEHKRKKPRGSKNDKEGQSTKGEQNEQETKQNAKYQGSDRRHISGKTPER